MSEKDLAAELANFFEQAVAVAERTGDIREVYQLLFEAARERLDAFSLGFWLLNLSEEAIENTALLGDHSPALQVGRKIALETEDAKRLLSGLSRRTQVFAAEEVRRDLASDDLLQPRTETLYIMPLFMGSQLLGAFALESARPPAPREQVDFLERCLPVVALTFVSLGQGRAEEKRLLQMKLLHQITEKALMTLNLDDLLNSTARLLKNYFLYYNVYIFIYDQEHDMLDLRGLAGKYEQDIHLPLHLDPREGCVGYAFRHHETYYAPDIRVDSHYVPELPDRIEALSELAVPIMQGNNILGVLDVQADKPGSFDEFDIESMNTLANELASAILRARDYEILKYTSEQLQVYQEQMERDLHISEQILNMNVPVDFVSPNLDSTLHFHAHRSIGGDIVLLKLSGEYSYVIVGDVSGHGISSALISTSTFSFIDNMLARPATVEAVVQGLNDFWSGNFKELGYYATFFIGRVHNSTGALEYVNCSHPRPLLYQSSASSLTPLPHAVPPVGLFDLDRNFRVNRQWLKLAPGDKLVLYTDGLLSEYPPPGEFTENDLQTLVGRFGSLPHPIFHQCVLWNLRRQRAGIKPGDDEVLLSLSYSSHPKVGHFLDSLDQTLNLIRKVGRLNLGMGLPGITLERLTVVLEETALALLARRADCPLPPRVFVSVDFQPRKFNLALLDANLFLAEENFLETAGAIPPLEKQLPAGALQMVKKKVPQVEIKKIDKGLLFVCPLE